MTTEKEIRDRLGQANAGVVMVPTWDEVRHLLHLLDDHRDALREAGADLRLMEESLAKCESETRRMGWM